MSTDSSHPPHPQAQVIRLCPGRAPTSEADAWYLCPVVVASQDAFGADLLARPVPWPDVAVTVERWKDGSMEMGGVNRLLQQVLHGKLGLSPHLPTCDPRICGNVLLVRFGHLLCGPFDK